MILSSEISSRSQDHDCGFLVQLNIFGMDKELGEDIINMYKAYENKATVWKKTKLNNQTFELPDYYQVVSLIGVGAYGAVAAAIDHRVQPKPGEEPAMVAIKKMTNAFEHKIFARRILRELKVLRLLKHPNIIEIKTIVLPKSRAEFTDIYAIFQLMDSDVTSLLRGEEQLNQSHYQYFVYQVLKGLKFMHTANIVHRDLKPRNLLIDANCDLKICDFGLARPMIERTKEGGMTDYVATRWYRAPELLLGQIHYTPAVDIWSVGCILAEILTRKPFLPANTTREQLQLICETIDMPEIHELRNLSEETTSLLTKIMKKKKKAVKLEEKMKKGSPLAIDLLKKMLTFDPSKRSTVQEALDHPYFEEFRQPAQEISRPPVDELEFEFDEYDLKTQQLKDLIYEEILLYHSKEFCEDYYGKLKKKESVLIQILKNSNGQNHNPITDDDDGYEGE